MSEPRRITPLEALRVIEDLAANAGLERAFFPTKPGETGSGDKVMDEIFMTAHAARCGVEMPDCGDAHTDWHADAAKLHDQLFGEQPT